jgi:Protein of unknown function (DUF2815)
MILESSALFTPRVSKLKPNDPPSFYARLLADEAAMKTDAWKSLEKAVKELGEQTFGGSKQFAALVQGGQFRSPVRRDIAGKGFPNDVVAFLNVKSGADYQPVVVGHDALPVMDQAAIYPGCRVRASLRIYAYGGRGTQIGAGVSFGLENVQKLGDGPRLKTARGDGSEFGRLDDDLFN